MMSKTFLDEFSESLITEHGLDGLKDVTIVIPSQRVALHVRESLLKWGESPFWMPRILPVNQFLHELHDFSVIDDLELIFELYQAYKESFEDPETFDEFLSWSSMIISDFNEIDKYLLDADQVFKNLQSIKDIESWSFNTSELSNTQKNFLKFWEQLGVLYKNLHSRLESKGETTNAKVYRNIAEEPEKYLTSIKEKVYFIGFNALSEAEEKIMKFMVSSGIGNVLWDVDDYYLSNSIMEAGKFIRSYRSWSGMNESISREHLRTKEKQINIYKANSNLQQVAVASKLMEQFNRSNLGREAVVLADETLLKPMLNVLPNDQLQLNVAMGYPLNAASVFSFFEELVQVQVNIERYKHNKYVYHKDFQQIVQHELFQLYAEKKEIAFDQLIKKVNKENYTYLSLELVEKELGVNGDDVLFMFARSLEVDLFVERVIHFYQELYGMIEENIIEQEALSALIEALEKLQVVQNRYQLIGKITTFNQITKQVLRGLKMSFLGEPLQGVQILGLLETRALDFEHVVLLSCNEDVLPKRSFTNSLIPYDLRVYLGLPSRDDKEAIFAYYFYRLIQRAEKVDLVYNGGDSEGLKSNEISRYILQIEEELKGEHICLRHVDVEPEISSEQLLVEENEQSAELLKERILDWFANGISASGMNQFNTCPRNFLYTQLMRFAQDEEVEEDIEVSTYGTIVHEVLENLYRSSSPMIGLEEVEHMLMQYESEVIKSFSERFPGGNYKTGKNLLMFETALYTIEKFLKSEKTLIKEKGVIKIIGLEDSFEKVATLQTSVGEIDVKIKGLIDRIDQIGDVVRIIDYKTGKVEKLDFKGDWTKVSKFQLQLLVYLYLFDSDLKVTSGMVSFKALSKGCQPLSNSGVEIFEPEWINNEFEREFEKYLLDFVESVLSSSFQHDPKSKFCVFC